MKRVSILLASLAATTSSHALASAEVRKSPYFIDGIHCEGLEGLLDDYNLKRQYPDEEVAAVGLKTIRQSHCEGIFKEYGIEKFQWVTPEDLEKLSFTLKRSNKFRSADIRIEKSDLQNHVHLIGVFTAFDPKTRYSLDFSSGLENDKSAGSRTTTKAEGSVSFNQRGLNNPAPYVLGVKYFNSTAGRPLNAEELRPNDQDVAMTDNEKAAQGRQNGYYGGAKLRINFPYSSLYRGIYTYGEVGLGTSRLTGDERSTSNITYELGTAYQYDPLIPTVTRFSLLYADYSATASEVYYTDKTKNSKAKSLVFAGFAQDMQTQQISGKLRFYRSLTTDMHYFGDFDLMFRLGEYAEMNHGLGFAETVIKGAVLPEHRFGLPDRQEFQLYYRADYNLAAFGAKNKAWLKVGVASYQAHNDLENSYSREQGFGELGLKTQTEDFDLGLSFIYGDRRLY